MILVTTDFEKHIDRVYEILEYSYKYIDGGVMRSKLDLLESKNQCWLLTYNNSNIDGVIIFKQTDFGMKLSLIGAITKIAKKQVIDKLFELIDNRESFYYGECSGKVLELMLSRNAPIIDPKLAQNILKKNVFSVNSDLTYDREIKGVLKTKMLIGNVNIKPQIQ